ncbi:MAG: MoxR family ATPase [Richelia sp. SM1_7_0]|nr:MoxR family ATPase [Richelia sp. SM1_7_0]
MTKKIQYTFTANSNIKSQNPHPDSPQEAEPYIAADELIKAVNLAIFLRRPLLIEGEAGCGKTRLARAVAYQLGLPYYRWDIRSTTKATEGLYEYDAILRLHDVETLKLEQSFAEERNPKDPKCYRYFGALGKAFTSQECPGVVLIDEIDKADVDFPNDLLAVLDKPMQFNIRETGESIAAKHEPIVIITSNKEKGNLPAPFLRRCLYFYLKFPSKPEELQRIVDIHYQVNSQELGSEAPKDELKKTAINRFLSVRKDSGLFKLPGTSEFLDWLYALQSFDASPYSAKSLEDENLSLPYPELLFKMRQDWQNYTSLAVS